MLIYRLPHVDSQDFVWLYSFTVYLILMTPTVGKVESVAHSNMVCIYFSERAAEGLDKTVR